MTIFDAYQQARGQGGSQARRPDDTNQVSAMQALQRTRPAGGIGVRPDLAPSGGGGLGPMVTALGRPAMLPGRTVMDAPVTLPAQVGPPLMAGGGRRNALLDALTAAGTQRVPRSMFDELGIAAGSARPTLDAAFPGARRFQAPAGGLPTGGIPYGPDAIGPAAPRLNYDPNGPRGSQLGGGRGVWLDGSGYEVGGSLPSGYVNEGGFSAGRPTSAAEAARFAPLLGGGVGNYVGGGSLSAINAPMLGNGLGQLRSGGLVASPPSSSALMRAIQAGMI